MRRLAFVCLTLWPMAALASPTELEQAASLRRGDGVTRDAKRAVQTFLRLCEANDAAACRAYGEMAQNGEGMEKSLLVAEHALDRACQSGDRLACVQQGRVLLQGVDAPATEGTPVEPTRPSARPVLLRDPGHAVQLFSSACQAGEPSGCTELAMVRARGDAGAKNLPEAVRLFRQACAARDANACQMLGIIYGNDAGDAKQQKEARALLGQQCAAKQAGACYGMGLWHRFHAGGSLEDDGGGDGHAPGVANAAAKQALTLIGRACELGDPRACHDLGVFAERGTFGASNAEEANRRYERGCALGFALSCFNLGVRTDPATGGADVARAESLYRKGCFLGENQACYNLSWLLLGNGKRKEALPLLEELCGREVGEACNKLGNEALSAHAAADALGWYRRACSDGLAMGCGNLGTVLLATDTPTRLRDEKAGYDALKLACTGGYRPSCDVLSQLK